jgi:hypothetical protein
VSTDTTVALVQDLEIGGGQPGHGLAPVEHGNIDDDARRRGAERGSLS